MDALRADDIIDRQRIRAKLTFWRIVALVIALIAIVTAAARFAGDGFGPQRDHVARIDITGTITEDAALLDLIDAVREDDRARGVILAINSPGGTTTGGEAIYEAVRKLAEEKPVVAQVGSLAASAGYLIATGADQIVVRQTSLVGSIGVIYQYPNFEDLLDSWGIDVTAIKSSPLKAEPNLFGEPPPEAEAMIRAMILDSFDWFKDLVAERRDFDAATINRLADGSIFTGRQALGNGLVDALGGEAEARAWLNERGVSDDLAVVTRKPKRDDDTLGWLGASALARILGVETGQMPAIKALSDRLLLDGLVSVWHAGTPEGNVPQ